MHKILSNYTASITDLKKEPMKLIKSSKGKPIAILNRNEPVFYCVPVELFEEMNPLIDDSVGLKETLENIPKIEFEVPNRAQGKARDINL